MNLDLIRNPTIKKFVEDHFVGAVKMAYLGEPVLADDDRIVTIANMKNGLYVIAAQPDVTRNLTFTHATVAVGTDTLGTLTVAGTDIDGLAISEIVTPVADTEVLSTKAYKTVTGITGAGWVIAGGNDTLIVGVGTRLGLPQDIANSHVYLGILGTALVVPTTYAGGTIPTSTMDISSGTYNGTKSAYALIVD